MPIRDATAKNTAVNAMFGDARATGMPATWYVALYVGDPGGAGTEVTGGSYARAAVANTNAVWGSATAGVKVTVVDVSFPTATANWGTVSHAALFDAASGGVCHDYGALDAATAVNSGSAAKFPTGQLRVSVT